MKSKYKIFFILILASLTACEDYLDIASELEFSEEDVYETYYTAQSYLDNCYRALYDFQSFKCGGLSDTHTESFSDNSSQNNPFTAFITGDWYDREYTGELGWADSNTGETNGYPIQNSAFCLRITNNLLENIESIPSTGASDEEKEWLMGQAYFFRAWYYFEWIRRLGGMPPVDKVYSSSDDLDLERLSYKESSEYIIADCEKAIDLLPDEWDDSNQGRAEKCSAYALRGMVALYAASPLMQNEIGETVERDDYDLEWLQDAAEYSYATLEYLENTRSDKMMIDPTGHTQDELDSLYDEVFFHTDYMGPEALWCKNHTSQQSISATTYGHSVEMSVLYQTLRLSGRSGNWGYEQAGPTQNLVDAYPLADGSYFDWDDATQASQPYANRDPRFYHDIIYPGEKFAKVGHVGVADKETYYTYSGIDKPAFGEDYYLETWEASSDLGGYYGIDIAYSNWAKTPHTGYVMKKWMWSDCWGKPSSNSAGWGTYHYNAEFIRTTQIWLDLAEALYELTGDANTTVDGAGPYTALECINKVRLRVGAEAVTDDDFRTRYRNERRIELCYENHRWYDIRRWMLFDDLFENESYPIKGITATLTNMNGTTNQEEWTYEYEVKDILTAPRNYTTKHYWYPIPTSHTEQLYNCEQNYGW
jgi:hypothetical protein